MASRFIWEKLLFGFVFLLSCGVATGQTQELVFLNWSDYLDPELVEEFEAQHNVKIKEVYYESDDERDALLIDSNGEGFDLAIVNGAMLSMYEHRDWLATIDRSSAPNINHIYNKWFDIFPTSKKYAVPYFWGTAGIAYRADLLPEPITSWKQLVEPDEFMRQKISLVKSSRDIIGMALKSLGYSLNSTEHNEIEEAGKLLLAQKPYVKSYSYASTSEKSDLVMGNTVAAYMYNGDVLSLKEYNKNIEYVLPKEGGNVWVDYLVVMNGSARKELAHQFINFLNQPENAAKHAQYLWYATPNQAAEKYLPSDFLSDPLIYPGTSQLKNYEVYLELTPGSIRQRNQVYNQIVH